METYREEDPRQFGGPEELPVTETTENEDKSVEYNIEDIPLDESEKEAIQEKKQKQRDPLKTQLNRERRAKYEALAEANRLKEELERVRQTAALTAQAAERHYDDNVMQNLERARQLKAQAIESGDSQAIVDADIALSAAVGEMQQLNSWKVQQGIRNQQQSQQQSYQNVAPEVANELEIRRWGEENTWFNPQSEDYDEDLAKEAQLYSDLMEVELRRHGMNHLIYSPEYFDTLNTHVNTLRNMRDQNKWGRRDLNMRSAPTSVTPVRSGGYYSSEPQKVVISSEERDLARRLGLDEKTYLKFKFKDRQKLASKGMQF